MKPVSHIASSSSRPPTLSQWNPKIGFYPSFDRCHKGNRLYRAGLRADSNLDILIARSPIALITILIVFIHDRALMTTVSTIDTLRVEERASSSSMILSTHFLIIHAKRKHVSRKLGIPLDRYVRSSLTLKLSTIFI